MRSTTRAPNANAGALVVLRIELQKPLHPRLPQHEHVQERQRERDERGHEVSPSRQQDAVRQPDQRPADQSRDAVDAQHGVMARLLR